jgi:peptidoglycan hydrolase-like protein with peptidoglycan-binding domain
MPHWFTREIRPGDTGPDVRAVKRILGLDYETIWDSDCVTVLRGYFGSDVITAEIAEKIGETAATAAGIPPEWWADRDLGPGDYGDDVDAVRKIFKLKPGAYDSHVENAVRRFQSNHEIAPTGRITEDLALLMGEAP